MIHTNIKFVFSILLLMGFSTLALANECGETPDRPAMIDGASATMAELVAASEQVKGYIAEADVFLDCHGEFIQTIAYKGLSSDEKDVYKDIASALLDSRNDIGDEFNAEVAAFREAQ